MAAPSSPASSLEATSLDVSVHIVVAAVPLEASITNILKTSSVMASSQPVLEAPVETSPAPATTSTTSVIAVATTTWTTGTTGTSLSMAPIPATLALGLTLGSEEPVDSLHTGPEVLELVEEQTESGVDNFVLLSLAGCNFSDLWKEEYQLCNITCLRKIAHLFLHEAPDIWFTQLPVQFLEAAEESESQSPGHHVPASRPLLLLLVRTFLRRPLVHLDNLAPAPVLSHGSTHVNVVAVADVLDVLGDAGVGPDPVLVHESDQF